MIKCANIPLSLSFPRSFDCSGFSELIFTSLIRISALNSKPWHNVDFTTSRAVPIKASQNAYIFEKTLSRFPGLPYLPMRDNSPTRVVAGLNVHPPEFQTFSFRKVRMSLSEFRPLSENVYCESQKTVNTFDLILTC